LPDEAKPISEETRQIEFARAIRQAYPMAGERLMHALDDAGVNRTQLKLLFILNRPHEKPPRISRVGEMLHVDPAQAARLVKDLDNKRCVDCTRDPNDDRVKRVVITPIGKDVVRQLVDEQYLAWEFDEYYARLHADEREALDRFLELRAHRP